MDHTQRIENDDRTPIYSYVHIDNDPESRNFQAIELGSLQHEPALQQADSLQAYNNHEVEHIHECQATGELTFATYGIEWVN